MILIKLLGYPKLRRLFPTLIDHHSLRMRGGEAPGADHGKNRALQGQLSTSTRFGSLAMFNTPADPFSQ